MNLPPQQRSQNDGPWCWQNKAARRLIRKRFSELNCISSALSVYDALCELASDTQSESFEMATPTIAKTAGVGTRTAQNILPKLKVFGFIDIGKRKFPGTNMDAPSIYTLLKIATDITSENNGCAPVGNSCAPVRNGRKQTSLRTSEESLKESIEESQKTTSSSTPSSPQSQATAGAGEGERLLTRDEIWERTCTLLGRYSEESPSQAEEKVLLSCSRWITNAQLQRLEDFERRKQAHPQHRRSETAHNFLLHAECRLFGPKPNPRSQASPAPLPIIDESDVEAMNRSLYAVEIWQRVCRLVGTPDEPQTDKTRPLLAELEGTLERTMRLVERYTAHEKKQRGFRGKRSAYTLLRDFDQQLRFAESWDENFRVKQALTQGSQVQPQPTRTSATSPAAPGQPAPPVPPTRPTVEEVFAFISPANWKREVAQAYINSRTRTDPPWHLPATNDRPARAIGPNWRVDLNMFLKNWNEIEAKKAAKASRDDDQDTPF